MCRCAYARRFGARLGGHEFVKPCEGCKRTLERLLNRGPIIKGDNKPKAGTNFLYLPQAWHAEAHTFHPFRPTNDKGHPWPKQPSNGANAKVIDRAET